MSGQEHNADKAWPFRPDHEQFGALRPPALRPATVSSRGRHRGRAVTGACEQIAAIWDQPHRGAATVAAARAELGATIRRLRDDELPAVISWAHDQLRQGRYQFWIVFSLSYIERDARDLACGDCASEVHGSAGDRWRYRVSIPPPARGGAYIRPGKCAAASRAAPSSRTAGPTSGVPET